MQEVRLFREDDVLLGDRVHVRLGGVVEQLFDPRPEVGGPLHQVEGVDRVEDVALAIVRPEIKAVLKPIMILQVPKVESEASIFKDKALSRVTC